MTDREPLKRQLADREEGLRLFAYDDATGKELRIGDTLKGNLSIGVGRNLSGKGISTPEAMTLLDDDLDDVLADCATFAWFPSLDDIRQRAVADLRFNVGPTGLRTFRKFIAAMARKDYVAAGRELVSSNWAKQVQPARVKELRNMIETGDDV